MPSATSAPHDELDIFYTYLYFQIQPAAKNLLADAAMAPIPETWLVQGGISTSESKCYGKARAHDILL